MDGIWEGYYGKNVMREELMIGVGLFFFVFFTLLYFSGEELVVVMVGRGGNFSYVRRIRKKR